MAVGANLQYSMQRTLKATLKRFLGQRAINTRVNVPQIKHLCYSKAAAAPTTGTADDTPNHAGDMCLYYGTTPTLRTPLSIWLATDNTVPTWVQIA